MRKLDAAFFEEVKKIFSGFMVKSPFVTESKGIGPFLSRTLSVNGESFAVFSDGSLVFPEKVTPLWVAYRMHENGLCFDVDGELQRLISCARNLFEEGIEEPKLKRLCEETFLSLHKIYQYFPGQFYRNFFQLCGMRIPPWAV